MTRVGYLGGFGRSGSTLLETIAAGFDEVCVLGEVVFVWQRGVLEDRLCGCGQPFSRCPFWQEVGALAFDGWRPTDARRMVELRLQVDRMRRVPAAIRSPDGSPFAQAMADYADRFAAVHDAAVALTGATTVIDSSKHASTAFVLRRRAATDLRLVHMIRDPRGVAYSWTKQMAMQPSADGTEPVYMHRYPPYQAALLWNAQNLLFDRLARTGAPLWRLRYEDLLTDPVERTHAFARFLGLPTHAIGSFLSDTEVRAQQTHQIAGNPIRFGTGAIRLRRDDAWRDQLPAGDRRLVTALTMPVMRHYGYREVRS